MVDHLLCPDCSRDDIARPLWHVRQTLLLALKLLSSSRGVGIDMATSWSFLWRELQLLLEDLLRQ